MRPSYQIGTVVFEPHPDKDTIWVGGIGENKVYLKLTEIQALGGVEVEETEVEFEVWFVDSLCPHWRTRDKLPLDPANTYIITGTARRQ